MDKIAQSFLYYELFHELREKVQEEDSALEGCLLCRLVLKKRKHTQEKARNNSLDNEKAITA